MNIVSLGTASFAENAIGTAYAAAADGVDGSVVLTWSIEGVDAPAFTMDAATGAVSFVSAPNFEVPADADADNRYAITVVVTDGTTEARQNVMITVTDVLDTPIVTSATSANFAENGTGTAYAATAGGVDGSVPLTWSLAGADAQAFAINSATGAVSFVTPPNFEVPADADADNRYAITVVVTDGTTESRQDVTITVTNVLDTPVVTSATSVNFAENGTGTAYAATAGGVGGSVPLTWSLAGADALAFTINAATGAVAFVTAPNFEAPADADADNRYAITVVVTDGTTESRQDVTITVTDVLDTPVVTSATSANFAENGTGIAYTATAGGLGGSVPLTWSLAGADAQAFTIDAATGAVSFVTPPNFEAPIDTDGDNRYAITVVVSDGSTEGRRDVAITVTGVNEAPAAGLAPALATAALNTTRVLSTAELLDGFTDPENDQLQVSNLSSQNASFISNGQGGWTVSRLRDTDHRVDFTYTVSDSLGNQMLASNRLFFAVAGTIMGAPSGFDSILGGDTGENFMALRWFNTIRAGGGDDTITGGEAAGRIYGEAGDDQIILRGTLNIAEGGAGNDTIDGSEGSSTINGGAGNDQLIVRGTGHVVLGEDGDDFIQGVGGGSRIDAGQGNNTVQIWGAGNEVLFGSGNNVVQGTDGNTTLVGGHGGNLISLNGASNTVTLGDGDNAVFFGAAANASLVAGGGRNAVQLRGWNNEVSLGDGGNVVWAGLGMTRVTTGAGADQIFIGGSGGSDISAGLGDDVIYTGGAVNDVLRGGPGHDQYVIRHATNSVVELVNEGVDTVWIEIDGYTLSAHVEIARLIAGAAMLTGSAGHDVLVANQLAASTIDAAAGDDVVYGSPYADVLTGGAGNDIFYACAGQDRYIYGAPGWGHDMIAGWESGAKLDMRGSGLAFGDLRIESGPGFVLVVHGADMIQVFGIDRLVAGDFLFG